MSTIYGAFELAEGMRVRFTFYHQGPFTMPHVIGVVTRTGYGDNGDSFAVVDSNVYGPFTCWTSQGTFEEMETTAVRKEAP